MHRRALLLGGGATVVVGGVAVAGERTDRGRRLLHRLGVLDSPDLAVPDGGAAPRYESFPSDAMHRDVRWGLAVPAGEPAATVVCLHGRGDDERFAFDTIGLHHFAAAAGMPLAVAAVDGGAGSYWHPRSDGTDAGALVLDELLPKLPEVPVVLLGWSMGGYGALLLATSGDARVRAAVAASPAVWHRAADAAPGAFDGADDFRANDVFRRSPTVPVRIDCGDDDPFAATAEDLRRHLVAAGGLRAGFHDAPTWRTWVPDQLAFIADVLGLPEPRHA